MTERPAKIFVTRRIPQAHAYMTEERYRLWGPNLANGRPTW